MTKLFFASFISMSLMCCKHTNSSLVIKKVGATIDSTYANQLVQAQFIFSNPNTNKITIVENSPSCPCTSTTLKSNTTIKAKSSEQFTFTVDPKRLSVGKVSEVVIALRCDTEPELNFIRIKIFNKG